MSDLEAVFRWTAPPGENETRMEIVPPAGSAGRHLSSVEIRAGGAGIVRLPFHLHGRDISRYHTVCVQNAMVMLRCFLCRHAITTFDPAEALRSLDAHYWEAHRGTTVRPTFQLVELVPIDPFTKAVDW